MHNRLRDRMAHPLSFIDSLTGRGRSRTPIMHKETAANGFSHIVKLEGAEAPHRCYAIGDVHGKMDLLERMVALIETDLESHGADGALVIGLGDYVDRGPDSRSVLELLASQPFSVPFIALAGNHEEMLLSFLAQPRASAGWCREGGLETLRSYAVPTHQIIRGKGYSAASETLNWIMPDDQKRFLRSMPAAIMTDRHFFCHAGVRPGVALDQQQTADLFWIREEFLASTEDFGRIVVHGHTIVPRVDVLSNRINVDTGAYESDRLSCLVLEGVEAHILSVTK